jgi:hypothetical protein
MTLTFGVALVLLAITAFYRSLPRRGKMARFVGTEWEGYAVVGLIGILGIGVIMVIAGTIELVKTGA